MRTAKKLFSLLLVSIMAFFIVGCGNSKVESGNGSQISPILVGIKVIGLDSRPSGVITKAAAVGLYSNNTSKIITDEVTFTSSDTSVAQISGTSLTRNGTKVVTIETINPGKTTIQATKEGLSGSYELTVTHPQLVSISIERADTLTKADGNLTVGQSVQAVAIGTFDNNQTAEIANVTWSTDGSGTVAVSDTGLITAKRAGNAAVTASLASISGGVSDTVSGTVVDTPIIKELIINGDNSGALGETLQLKALLSYNPDQLPYDVTNKAVWSSDNPNIVVTNGEIRGEVYAKKAGDATIIATYGGISAKYAVHFSEAVPVKLEIQESYYEGGKGKVISGKTVEVELIEDNQDLYNPTHPNAYYPTAWAVYSDGTKHYVNTQTLWWSDDQRAVYVNFIKGSFVFGRDLVNGAKVTAYWKGLQASFNVDVVKSAATPTLQSIELKYGGGQNAPDITGKTVNLAQGRKFWLESWGHYDDNTTKNINAKVFYSSSNNSVAWIFDPINSYVHARRDATGDANITVTWQGKTAYTTVHVIPKEEIGDANSAKDAASLNGVLYPVVVPAFQALKDFVNNDSIDDALNETPTVKTIPCNKNDASSGTYTITKTDNKVVIDYGFGTCKAKNAESVAKRAILECGASFLDKGLPLLGLAMPSDSSETSAAYYALTEGQIVCSKETTQNSTKLTMQLIKHKSETHNKGNGKNNVWTHDMTIQLVKNPSNVILYGSGNSRGINYNGEVGSGTVESDETYMADNFTLNVDMKDPGVDTIKADGHIGYELKQSIWYPGDAGKVYTMDFDGFSYKLDGTTANTDVAVNGKISANCMGATVEYDTTETLFDDNANRDVNGSRIPYSGQMTLSSLENGTGIVTDTKAFQTFASSGSRTGITVNANKTNYTGWRDITTTSQCSILQEFIDRALDQ